MKCTAQEMRKQIALLLLLTLPYMVIGQETINHVDTSGLKQGKWVYYGKDRPTAGFPEDSIIEEGNYIDNKKNGIWVKYYDSGRIKLKGEYFNNRPCGHFQTFYENGVLRQVGSFNARNRGHHHFGTLLIF